MKKMIFMIPPVFFWIKYTIFSRICQMSQSFHISQLRHTMNIERTHLWNILIKANEKKETSLWKSYKHQEKKYLLYLIDLL